jgi:hypothetical protein
MNNARSREPPITGRGASTGEANSDPATFLGKRGQRAAIDKPSDPPPSPHHSGASHRRATPGPCRGRPDPRAGWSDPRRKRAPPAGAGQEWSLPSGLTRNPPPHPRRICWRRGWVWRRPAHPALGFAATGGARGWAGPLVPVTGGAPLHGLHEREQEARGIENGGQ